MDMDETVPVSVCLSGYGPEDHKEGKEGHRVVCLGKQPAIILEMYSLNEDGPDSFPQAEPSDLEREYGCAIRMNVILSALDTASTVVRMLNLAITVVEDAAEDARRQINAMTEVLLHDIEQHLNGQ